jgi:hypothetical protein
MATEKNLNGNDTVHPLATVSNRITSVLDRLPTLDDVLHRQSQPPVCLYNYYIVLRDRLEIETLLDFWLDVAQAEILYKRYAKYAARAAAANKHTGTNNTNTSTTLHAQVKPSISSSISSSPLQSPDILTQMLLVHPRASYATTMTTNTNGSKRPPPTLTEMTETIERIYLRYIVPSAEKELVQLPVQIRDNINTYFHDKASPENPAIYAQAKEYVHQLLQSTFPLFLRYKAFMNLTLAQQLGRLACGLVLLLFGFSLEFSLIFLDIRPWQKRLWVMTLFL